MDVGFPANILWLITSADRRVSVWASNWGQDICEPVDWLTFPATTNGTDQQREDLNTVCNENFGNQYSLVNLLIISLTYERKHVLNLFYKMFGSIFISYLPFMQKWNLNVCCVCEERWVQNKDLQRSLWDLGITSYQQFVTVFSVLMLSVSCITISFFLRFF